MYNYNEKILKNEKTKIFLIAFSGRYSYNESSNILKDFLYECGVLDLLKGDDVSLFLKDDKFAVSIDEWSEISFLNKNIILPFSFNTEIEALAWFNEKAAKFKHFKSLKKENIKILDKDKVLEYFKSLDVYKAKKKEIINKCFDSINNLKKEMEKEFLKDTESIEIFENIFKEINYTKDLI